jgi:tetratricopeptide (TPR) repeat protein
MRRLATAMAVCGVMLFPGVSHAVAAADPAGANPASSRKVSEYGINLALNGRLDDAERAFLSQLSLTPGDAGALNGIGNVYCLRGDLEVALAFYDRAAAADSTDAGIRLNRAVVLMIGGEQSAARAEAALAIKLAGGPEKAEALMALKRDRAEVEPSKGASSRGLSPEAIRNLLQAAARLVTAAPVAADTMVAVEASPRSTSPAVARNTRGRKQLSSPQTAGPRGADGGDAALCLYWRP